MSCSLSWLLLLSQSYLSLDFFPLFSVYSDLSTCRAWESLYGAPLFWRKPMWRSDSDADVAVQAYLLPLLIFFKTNFEICFLPSAILSLIGSYLHLPTLSKFLSFVESQSFSYFLDDSLISSKGGFCAFLICKTFSQKEKTYYFSSLFDVWNYPGDQKPQGKCTSSAQDERRANRLLPKTNFKESFAYVLPVFCFWIVIVANGFFLFVAVIAKCCGFWKFARRGFLCVCIYEVSIHAERLLASG